MPANGFYDWRTIPGAARKQPWYVHPTQGPLFGFAGLIERWQGPEGVVRSCTILTCEANETLAPIHERMPCILAPQDYGRWLDPAQHDREVLQALLRPADPALVAAYPVGPAVGNARNESPDLILPAS